MSPDQPAQKRRRVDPHRHVGDNVGDGQEGHQQLPLAVPPLTVHAAPPSPPSPPVSSVSALALFAAEMVAWLWFAPSPSGGETGTRPDTILDRGQVRPTDRFVQFCQEVLTTTQVSESVVLLALLFISRLKQRNSINGAPGSEYRLAVTGLMLANKILDDNTYTAQTWSQVSSLELKPLVAGEAEFLRGLNWSLHVTGRDFEAWRKLLDGHVAARQARISRLLAPPGGFVRSARRPSSSSRARDRGRQGAVDLRGLGIGLEAAEGHALHPMLHMPPLADATLSASRYPLARPGVVASAHTTPKSAFAAYSFGTSSAPPKAHPASSAPLPQYNAPMHSTEPSRSSLEVSPTTIAFYKRNAGLRASAPLPLPGIKRTADDAFAHDMPTAYIVPAIPPHVQPQHVEDMVRSYSAGPAASSASTGQPPHASELATVSAQPFYVHPAHHASPIPPMMSPSPYGSRPASSSSSAGHPPPPPLFFRNQAGPAAFSTLSDAFSPRYEPEERRRLRQGTVTLGYYSLAAGHGLGHLRQTLPPPPMAAAWPVAPDSSQYAPYSRPAAGPVPFAYPPPPPVAWSATSSPIAPPPFDSFAQQQRPRMPSPPFKHHVGGLAALPMATSASQSAPMRPPRPHGHRRTSSGHSLRGSGGGGSPVDLTSTPGRGPSAYSPTSVSDATHPFGHGPHPLSWPPAMPQQPTTQQLPFQGQYLGPPPQGVYYSAYSNAGVPGVYYRG